MSALSTRGISPEAPEAPLLVQIIWGVTVGLVAIILVASAGIDGIRMMSVLGGFPALFVITGAALSLVVLTVREIGSASGRERVCQYGWISGVAVSLKKKMQD